MQSVAEEFRNIYEREWQEAYQYLNKERHNEEVIYLLMRVVRGVYDLCLDETKAVQQKKKTPEELMDEYLQHHLPLALHKDHMSNPMKSYIQRCIECLLKLCSLVTSPYIYWTPKGELIDLDKFEIQGNQTELVCDWTVWPAVVDNDNTVLTKGVAIPIPKA